ncbi:MAG: YqgE/AlgH family protein [Myxococcaceae bacterium]
MNSVAPALLIAMPQLGDPHFQGSVVLLIDHDADGAMGLILNRPSPVTLAEMAKTQSLEVTHKRGQESVFAGGPVERQRGFALHARADMEEKREVCAGLYLSVTMPSLTALLRDDASTLRFCLGYAGWGPQQLEAEVRSGAWLVSDLTADVLESPPKDLWQLRVRGMGIDPAMLLSGTARGMN